MQKNYFSLFSYLIVFLAFNALSAMQQVSSKPKTEVYYADLHTYFPEGSLLLYDQDKRLVHRMLYTGSADIKKYCDLLKITVQNPPKDVPETTTWKTANGMPTIGMDVYKREYDALKDFDVGKIQIVKIYHPYFDYHYKTLRYNDDGSWYIRCSNTHRILRSSGLSLVLDALYVITSYCLKYFTVS